MTRSAEALIREAADLEQQTVTEFVVGAAVARARSAIGGDHTIKLSNEAFDRFLEALDAPAEPMPAPARLVRSEPPDPRRAED